MEFIDENAFSSCVILHQGIDNIIYRQSDGSVAKIYHSSFPQEKRNQVSKMVHHFLIHPETKHITPKKAFLSVNGLSGYEMDYESEYEPVSKISSELSQDELESLLRTVEVTVKQNNEKFIYEDIDIDNILYKDGMIKLIDFDDCYITSELTKEKYDYAIQHQKYVLHMFSLSLLYKVSLKDIYFLSESEMVSDDMKEEIQSLLQQQYDSIDELLDAYHQLKRKK